MSLGEIGNSFDFRICNNCIVNIYTDKVLRTVRQLYSAQRLDLKAFYTIVCSATPFDIGGDRIEICSDIIAWAEKLESDEATAIYWLAHDCLAEIMK